MSRRAGGRLLGASVGATTRWMVGAAGFNAVAGVFTARALGPEDRGVLAVLLTVVGLATVFGSLGSNVVIRGDLPRLGAALLHSYRSLTRRLMFGVYLPLTAGALVLTQVWIGFDFRITYLAPLALYAVVTFEWFQTQEALSGSGRILTVARTSALGSLVLAALLTGAYLFGLGLAGAVACYAVAMLVQSTVARIKLRAELTTTEDRVALSHFLKNGPEGPRLPLRSEPDLPSGPLSSRGAGRHESGGHLRRRRDPGRADQASDPAAGQFTLLNAARDQIPLRVVVKRAAVAVGVAAVCAAAGAVIVPFLIPVVYGEDFADASPIFLILILAQVLLAPYMIFSRALVGYGGRSSSSVVGVVGVLVLVGSILVLVPAWGAVGCAVAACAAYAAMSLTAVPLCVRASKRQQPGSQ